MALQSLLCPNCRGQIDTFDNKAQKGTCPYCGSIIVNIPELQNQFKLDSEGRVVVSGIEGSDELYQRIEANLEFGDRGKSVALAREYTEKYPRDFRGWAALAECSIDDAFERGGYNSDLTLAFDRMGKISLTESEKQRLEKLKSRIVRKRADTVERLKEIERDLVTAEKEVEEAKAADDLLDKDRSKQRASSLSDIEETRVMVSIGAVVVAWIAIGAAGILDFGWGFVAGIVIGVVVGKLYASSVKRSREERGKRIGESGARLSSAYSRRSSLSAERDQLNAFTKFLDELLESV